MKKVLDQIKSNKRKKLKKVLIIIVVVWALKLSIGVAVRENQNKSFLQMAENNKLCVLHVERKLHFFSFKYGIIGVSYHYTMDVYDFFHPTRMIGTDDYGTFRISLLHYGYVQEYFPMLWIDDEMILRHYDDI